MNRDDFKKQLIKRAIELGRSIMQFVEEFPNRKSSMVIINQLLRAGTSIGANIIEAQAASSKKDFVNFLNHALKSGNEAKFWLLLSKDLSVNLHSQANILLNETDELVRILGSSIRTLKNKN